MTNQILKDVPPNVRIVAVSKFQAIEKIRALHDNFGIRDFGENYVQEAGPKMAALADLNLNWHFVGRIQSNKIKFLVGKFSYIHSVDSADLIKKISELAKTLNIRQRIFLQVNLANEESKGGFQPPELEENFITWSKYPGVEIVGLMTMPPLALTQEDQNKSYFSQLKKLAHKLGVKELSMGTSADYKTAILEGATMIRLGTVLFGERPSKI